MARTPGAHHQRVPEAVVPGKRLGRHVHHDPRSRNYEFPAHTVATLRSVRHTRIVPVFDQGEIGSCTGNALTGATGCDPFFAVIPDSNLRKPTADAVFDEQLAVQLYSDATKLDSFRGTYPPTDTGSNGLSVCKAAVKAGLIKAYQHTFSLDAALKALTVTPVIAGINWYDSFDDPDGEGVISIADGAQVRGGHEICIDEIDVERKRIGFTNSWGTGWGTDGRAFLSWEDFGRLLDEHGDVTVPVPLDAPADPTPITPTPAKPKRHRCPLFSSARTTEGPRSMNKILGRDPVVITTLVATALQLVNALWLHWTDEQTAAINAAVAIVLSAVATALVSTDKALPLLSGVIQALLTVGAVFGYHLSADKTTALMAFVAAALAVFGVRPQVTAKVDAKGARR